MSIVTNREAHDPGNFSFGSTVNSALDAGDISRSMRRICSADDTAENRRRTLARLLVSQRTVVAATIFDRADDNNFRPTVPLIHLPKYSHIARSWAAPISKHAQTVASSSAARVLRLPGGSQEFTAVLAPAVCGDSVVSVVCAVGRHSATMGTELSLIAQLAAAELAAAMSPTRKADGQTDANASSGLLDRIWHVSADGDIDRGFYEVACQLRDETDAHLVFLGAWDKFRRRCILQAISTAVRYERHSPLGMCAEEVLNEAVLRKAMESHDGSDSAATDTSARKRLAQLCQGRGFVSGPIRGRNDISLGAWVIVAKESRDAGQRTERAARTKAAMEKTLPRLAPCFELLQHIRPSPLQRIAKGVLGPDAGSRRYVILAVALVLACLMALPLPYRVKCDCEVQAVTRRFVPAAYDGVLREVLVEPGDVVSAGQVLARMDGREIELELGARQAEYNRSRKLYGVQLAAQDTSAAQVAKLEMERLKLKIELLENRAGNLEIRSPIDGIVLGGDPKKKEHARLTMGEALFEVGPLEEMVVDVFVPDEDIAYVEPEQEVRIRLDAFPGSQRDGTIKRISPQAEVRGQDNVFVAEVELHNPDRVLRPGMKGRSRVSSVVRPLAWNLFHRAWDRLVYHFAW